MRESHRPSATFLWILLPQRGGHALHPHLLLEFYLAQESLFKQGWPLAWPPDPAESIQCQRALDIPEAREAAVNVIRLELLPEVTAVGSTLASLSKVRAKGLKSFTLHEHGVEGDVLPTDRLCLVVPEVKGDAAEILQALATCRKAYLNPLQVLVLLDHQEGGLELARNMAGSEVQVTAITTRSRLHTVWLLYMT
jgi:hypothetical protein